MRRNFAQIMKNAAVDIYVEYQRLYDLFYRPLIKVYANRQISMHDVIGKIFIDFHFRGTCLTLEEFDYSHGFLFERSPEHFDIDNLISLCEYMYNMLEEYQLVGGYDQVTQDVTLFSDQIQRVIELVGYETSYEDGFTIYVEKSPAARSVAESDLIPDSLSYKIIEYNHHSLKGNLEKKKAILLQLAVILEGKRRNLKEASPALEKELFFLFNNLNIRHNNVNPEEPAKYKQFIAQMPPEEIEKWYDEIYQMCLLAFLQIEHSGRKANLVKLKNDIEGCTN